MSKEIISGDYEAISDDIQAEWNNLSKIEKIKVINSVTGCLIKN